MCLTLSTLCSFAEMTVNCWGFRFGQSRKEAEGFVNSFEDVSVTQRLRIMGDDVRLFRCEPLQCGDAPAHSQWPAQAMC